MRYVSWATFYEGASDGLYLDVLIPRVIKDLIEKNGLTLVDVPDQPSIKLGRNGRSIENVSREACEAKDAYDIVFIHADTGGRGLEKTIESRSQSYCEAISELCGFSLRCCITLTPRHETEAWLLADSEAVTRAIGYKGDPSELGLPTSAKQAERLTDPKRTLKLAVESVSGQRRSKSFENIFTTIAQNQHISLLEGSSSFMNFKKNLHLTLQQLGYLRYY